MAGFSTGIPDGVTTLDFGPFVIAFQQDGKIIFLSKDDAGKHLTIHLGGVSGILDAHLTDPRAPVTHQPLGGIRSDDLARFFEAATPTLERDLQVLMRRILRPVRRYGWLGHHGMVVLPFWPFEADGLLEVGHRRGKRWIADHDRLMARIGRPLSRADVEAAPDVAFNIFHRRRPQEYPYAVLFKYEDECGRRQFAWFKSAAMMHEGRELWRAYEPHVNRLLIEPSQVLAAMPRERKGERGSANE